MLKNVIIERVKGFLKWNPHRFENLDDKSAVAPLDPWGWRRNSEWWVKPAAWGEMCGDDLDPQEVARTLKGLDLLRVQDDRRFQIVAKVGNSTPRVYAVSDAIFEWKPPVSSGGFASYAGAVPGQYGRDFEPSQGGASPLTAREGGSAPADLATKLEAAVGVALDEMLRVLGLRLDPTAREFGAIIRAKSSIISTALNTQTRVDDMRLKNAQRGDRRAEIMRIVKSEREKIRLLDAQAGVRQPPIATPGEAE